MVWPNTNLSGKFITGATTPTKLSPSAIEFTGLAACFVATDTLKESQFDLGERESAREKGAYVHDILSKDILGIEYLNELQ